MSTVAQIKEQYNALVEDHNELLDRAEQLQDELDWYKEKYFDLAKKHSQARLTNQNVQIQYEESDEEEDEYEEETSSEDEAIEEASLVALSAIFAVDESWIIDDEKFNRINEGQLDALLREKYPAQFAQAKKLDKSIEESMSLVSFMAPLKESIERHIAKFGNLIFIEKQQREKFLRILAASNVN